MQEFEITIAIISILVSLVTFKYSFNGNVNFANICLSAFLFLMGVYGLSHYIINYSKNIILIACVLNIFTPLYVAIGPTVYLYTKKTLNDNINECSVKDILYLLIPVIIITIDLSPHLFSSFSDKVEIANNLVNNIQKYRGTKHLLFTDGTSTLIRQISNFIFFIFSTINLKRIKVTTPLNFEHNKIALGFLNFLNISNLIFTFLMLNYLAVVMKFKYFIFSENVAQYLYNLTFIIHGIIVVIILFYPSVLYNLPQKQKNTKEENKYEVNKKIYKQFTLEDDYISIIKNKLDTFLEDRKIGEDFKLSTLTIETMIPTHHLNLFFKEELKISFTDWKNKHKLKYVLKLINEGSLNNLTIEAIAMKSGFPTYSNFYNIFKEEMNQTPSEYVQSISKSI
jgi:AraC-like DNA-binding protein